ncbi:MAG TPA: biopolymer transporter ExbD [Chryseosolibacter sp.]|nr:biopolymer transporter ExbD [Chryseosolibacter sp.]
MAQVDQPNKTEPGGKVRAKKQSTRIDMTPMVDLAFLLLTFFILTTTFTKDNVLKVQMPESAPPSPVNDENVMNLVLADDNKLFWWMGLEKTAAETNYSRSGIRKLLLDKRKSNPNLIVLIKAKDDARYENMIDILDEMEITAMEKYAIVDYTEDDALRLK